MKSDKRHFWMKSGLVIAAAIVVMHLPARDAAAASFRNPACITACCFCVSPQQVFCADAGAYCADQGCGAPVSCGFDQRCDNVSEDNELIECVNPNR